MDEVRVPGKSLDLPGNRKVLAEELNWLRKRGSEIEKRRVRKGSSAFGHGKAFVIHPVKEGRGFGKTKGLHIKVHSSSRVTEAQVDSDSEYFDARSLKEIEGFHAENKTEQIITSVQLVGIIAVIVTSGAISLPDVIFVIFASIYSMTLAFVLKTRASQETHEVSGWKTSVFNYLETILGLFLPLVFALGGFTRSDSAAVQAATPHVFFVACHLLSKIVVSSTPSCPPAKAFLTIMYNARCFFTAINWFGSLHLASNQTLATNWQKFGGVIAFVNMLFWAGNLLFYCIPVELTQAYEEHFRLRQINSTLRVRRNNEQNLFRLL